MSDVCPACGVDLAFSVDERDYSNKIGVEVMGVYDGVLYWECPDCGHRWNRWPEDHPLHAVAKVHMERANARRNASGVEA